MPTINAGCLPATPVAHIIGDAGWKELLSVSAAALTRYWPVSATVLQFDNMFAAESENAWLRQVEVWEAGTTPKSGALIMYLYTDAAPTAPTLGAVYSAATANLIGAVEIPAANYKRVSGSIVRAMVLPNILIQSGTTATATTIYGVVLSDAVALDYDPAPLLYVRLRTELCV